MIRLLKTKLAILCAMIIATMTTSCESYEKRIAKLEKAATEFKASLGDNDIILAEVIDSTSQEIVYLRQVDVDDSWDFTALDKDIFYVLEARNYATEKTEKVMEKWPQKEDYRFFSDSRLIKDRLFICLWDGRYSTAVVYMNVRDNTIHDVAFPEKAELSDNQITLTEMYLIHDSEYENDKEYGRKEFILNTSFTDAEYEIEAQRRAENILYLERIAKVKGWLTGTWESRTTNVYGMKMWARYYISDNSIIYITYDGIGNQGPCSYSIDLENNAINFGNHCAKISIRRKEIYAGDDVTPYYKISNSSSYPSMNLENSYNY